MTFAGPIADESRSPANRFAGVMDALDRGATVVAASPRAARALRLLHARSQRTAGRLVWPSPLIFDWDSWLRDLWRNHAFANPDAPLLLSPLQERALWTRLQRGDAELVLSPESLAALAMEAWSLLSRFGAHSARRHSWESTDAEHFCNWAQDFDRECATQNWLSASQLESRLGDAPVGNLALPAKIDLVGFDRFTPAQTEFLSFLRTRGVAVAEDVSASVDAQRTCVVASGHRDEIAACAAWARQILSAQPDARLGIISPDVASSRGEIEREFRRALLPSADDIRRPSLASPFEFSLGQPLAEIPAVRAALLLLRWITRPLRTEEISWLMLSGFLADTATHHLDLAARDAIRRETAPLVPERSLLTFRESLHGISSLRSLASRLDAFSEAVQVNRILEQPRTPSAWTELVPLLLDRMGWPGERPSDSVQFQALQRWHSLLDEIALLDLVASAQLFPDFLRLLELHAGEAIFAPESADAPIQILGPLESAGQQFDAIWFLSADDTRWPAPGRPHPFLPASVQRQFGMPHATPQNDWDVAHAVTARLFRTAQQVVVSYAQHDEDAELRPSPLLAEFFPRDTPPHSAAEFLPSRVSPRNASLETIPDGSLPLPWPNQRPAGGAEVLKRQAACPFQSFAAKRLAAAPLETADWGLDPVERGKVLHAILQQFFRSIPSHAELVTAMAADQVHAILDRCIDSVLGAYSSSGSWQQAYLAAEKRRLHARLEEWLACEAQRLPFTVEQTEHELPDVHIGDLRLKLRADRIDRLPDGSRLIIDYKTGRISPAVWNGDRPDEPQLPLYAVCGNVENVSGVLFAKIRAGETGFEGRVRVARSQLFADLSPRKKLVSDPLTASMLDQWSRALRALAQEFLQGEAAVAPRELEVCRNCPLPALCRKEELDLTADDDDEGDADA